MNEYNKYGFTDPIKIAIIGNEHIRYDAYSEHRQGQYDETLYDYIGEGYIYSIDGHKQTITKKYHFWVLNSNRPLR